MSEMARSDAIEIELEARRSLTDSLLNKGTAFRNATPSRISPPNFDSVEVIVVSDASATSLGNQGAGGMGIAVGELSLYATTLLSLLDLGTDNLGAARRPALYRLEARTRARNGLFFVESFRAFGFVRVSIRRRGSRSTIRSSGMPQDVMFEAP
jgi:hypothetical protein